MSAEAILKTWKSSYKLDVEMIEGDWRPESLSFATGNGKGWTWFDEKIGKVTNVIPVSNRLVMKVTSTVPDMISIARDLEKQSSWSLEAGKSTFHWIEDIKKCDYSLFVDRNREKLKSLGYEPLLKITNEQPNYFNQTYFKNKNSLSISIEKNKKFCHRKILYSKLK